MAGLAHPNHDQPRRWGVLGAMFWVLTAFFLPQFFLLPIFRAINSLPADMNTKRFIAQAVVELAAVLILWLALRKIYHSGFKAIGLGRIVSSKLAFAAAVFPLYLVVSTALISFVGTFFSVDLDQTQDIGYDSPEGFGLILIFIALVCLAPFVEEMLFRGFLFNAFRRTFGFWVGALLVSLVFALAHGQLNVGIDVFVLSMFLCYLREKTDSLWPSITMHALKNLLAFVILFIIGIK